MANWKMNGVAAALPILAEIDAIAAAHPSVQVTVSLPATLISAARQQSNHLIIGAQDCHAADNGPFTGCLSAVMLAEAGAQSIIVGHSERRRDQREKSADVAAKAEAARRNGLSAIICVGESAADRDAGRADTFVCGQLMQSVPGQPRSDMLTVAYEPVWAVGTGRTPELHQIDAVHAALRGTWRDIAGDDAEALSILYGGSVTGLNALDILSLPNVDGALVGGASLTAETFEPIIIAAAKAANR